MANNNVNMSELKRSFTGSFTGSFCICNVNLADDSAVSVSHFILKQIAPTRLKKLVGVICMISGIKEKR